MESNLEFVSEEDVSSGRVRVIPETERVVASLHDADIDAPDMHLVTGRHSVKHLSAAVPPLSSALPTSTTSASQVQEPTTFTRKVLPLHCYLTFNSLFDQNTKKLDSK